MPIERDIWISQIFGFVRTAFARTNQPGRKLVMRILPLTNLFRLLVEFSPQRLECFSKQFCVVIDIHCCISTQPKPLAVLRTRPAYHTSRRSLVAPVRIKG